MSYRDIVRKVVGESDIVIEVIDARFPEQSRNQELEGMVKARGKKLLIVVNKSDLVTLDESREQKRGIGIKSVFVSAKQKKGTANLRKAIGELSSGKEVRIGITGYPNTGKSSVINMLKGKKSSGTSSSAGFTKGMQYVRISKKIVLIDTPGVIPVGENDETLMALLSSKSPDRLKDLEGTGLEITELLLKANRKQLEETYGVKAGGAEEFLEKLALEKNKLLKAGKPDLPAAARIIITDFQKGKIGLKESKPKD